MPSFYHYLLLRFKAWSAIFITASLLSACTMAPRYQRPQVNSNVPLKAPLVNAQVQKKASDISWQHYFADPVLKELITIGLKNNYEVQKAMLNLKRAHAQYGLDIYNLIPNLSLDGISKSRSAPLDSGSRSVIEQKYNAGLGVTHFELDVYRKFDQGGATKHALKASYYDQVNTEITLTAAIAKKYFATRIAEQLKRNAHQTYAYQKELYHIQSLREKAGLSSKLELLQQQNALDQAHTALLEAEEIYSRNKNELAVLIGEPLPKVLPAPLPLNKQFYYTALPTDIPSEVMLYRPDIRSLEEKLQQANAEIGVARAALFPHILLNSTLLATSNSFNTLFHHDQIGWSVRPTVTLPLFDIFPNITHLKLSKIAKETMVLDYQHAIQQAFFEVITALNVFDKLNKEYILSDQIQKNTRKTRDLTRLRFNQGITDRNEMLEAEKTYIDSQNSYLKLTEAKLFNQVDLYTSLGGGSMIYYTSNQKALSTKEEKTKLQSLRKHK